MTRKIAILMKKVALASEGNKEVSFLLGLLYAELEAHTGVDIKHETDSYMGLEGDEYSYWVDCLVKELIK